MNRHKIKNYTVKLMMALGMLLILWVSFGGRGDADVVPGFAETDSTAAADNGSETRETSATEPTETEKAEEAEREAEPSEVDRLLADLDHDIFMCLLPDDTIRAHNPYEAHYDSMPPGGVKMRINRLQGGALARVFNDSNYLHITSAEKIGVKPVSGLSEAWHAGNRLRRLQSCREYYLDNLTHSLPYLVPEAHTLLADIGKAFRDSLQARGGGDYRIKVTSVLRTPKLVRRLRRRNRNAVDTSAHLYGTTFDISYAKFICDSVTVPRTQEDMKNLLAEVVYAMREKGRCYVKYERKQACFHITAR